LIDFPAVVPNLTAVIPVKFAPVMVTDAPPAVAPLPGLTELIEGAAIASAGAADTSAAAHIAVAATAAVRARRATIICQGLREAAHAQPGRCSGRRRVEGVLIGSATDRRFRAARSHPEYSGFGSLPYR
jgi:hypothetical protein